MCIRDSYWGADYSDPETEVYPFYQEAGDRGTCYSFLRTGVEEDVYKRQEYAESLYTDEEFQLRRANYSAHCMPFTKESLFSREIFEKYYHDQSRTIVGFWMPNKACLLYTSGEGDHRSGPEGS